MQDFYLIAEIKSADFSDGFVSVLSYSDFPDRFFRLNKVYIDVFGAKRLFFVDNVVFEKSNILLKFKNFDSDYDTQFLVGKYIYIEHDELISLDEDTFFIHDLIGCKVFLNDSFFGILEDVLRLSSNDIYVIKKSDGDEVMVPAVKDYIGSFNKKELTLTLKKNIEYLE